MNKIMILLVTFLLINIVPTFAYEAEIYEKDGCIYIIGNLTEAEKQLEKQYYKERMTKREIQINTANQRNHEIKLETIKAQAMKDYLIAQGMPLREIADALRKIKIKQNIVIGDINAYSSVGEITNTNTNSATGGSATTGTITNTNSATGGSAGTSTHNNY